MERLGWAVVVGQMFSFTALAFGIFFFIFASKYYVAILLALFGGARGNGNGRNGSRNNHGWAGRFLKHFRRGENLLQNGNNQHGDRYQNNRTENEPFVSIQLPFYNEKNVARRIIQACVDIDYTNYEVLILDDSRDETVEILKEVIRRKGPPVIKVVHRKDRRGFKGGALAEALGHMDPRTEYIVVFDADFIPPPDIIRKFLWYFGSQNGINGEENNNDHRFAGRILNYFDNRQNNGQNSDGVVEQVEEWYERRRIAAVQGYQLHHLNKRENWITRGVRAEYSGSYMIERVSEEFFGAMKMISGSVFMLRADLVRKYGWTTSITEDWDLTLRLYLNGYKVVYTPLIQAPAEIPTTIQRLARQRMRWAEGHTFAVKKYFWDILRSPMVTFREKLEFLYFAPYYLQSFFFLMGTLCWMTAELLHQHPWFWTATFGWCLLLSNLFSLPLMGIAGLFLERNALDDFTGVLSLIVLSYVLTPFQAYAALKGLLEKEEGTWIRTLKTGTITDRVLGVRIRRLVRWILPRRRRRRRPLKRGARRRPGPTAMALIFLILMSSIIAWVTAAAISMPKGGAEDETVLTFEYVDPAVDVNGIETNRILTHPDFKDLGKKPHIDRYTTSSSGFEHAWSFYLHGPLEEDYRMEGRFVFILYLRAKRAREVDIWFKIRDVDENGIIKNAANIKFWDVKLDKKKDKKPIALESDPVKSITFEEGHSILVEIRLKSDSKKDVTYYFSYDSKKRWSRIEFPGMVVPERALVLVFVAPLIPVAMLKMKKRDRDVKED
ncbi:MAG: glycosyltransferase [Candidatus Bathyarchaeota archaeon]|nr:glycosyltransferase [Candidatus Bathyarchaeota archaeon]